ncbi:MAG: MmcQ/YjbR family DNA-binding protein [Bacteroidota bacterium]|nr:MmcQ/YjbR family DNA-binding protein [Bacteroidota bacterium]
MDIETFRNYCLAKKGTSEECPFGPDTLVFKVMGKLFALCSLNDFQSINLKCNPEKAIELREEYPQIQPGYHMNKTHWNTVYIEGLSSTLLKELIDHSHDLVKSGLTKQQKKELEGL